VRAASLLALVGGLAGLVGCSVEGIDETGTPLSVTGGALAVLASDQVDLPLVSVDPRSPHEQRCPGYRLVHTDADFGGSHVTLDLEVGDCPRAVLHERERTTYLCEGDALPFGQHGHPTPLDGCRRDELDGGRVLYTGTHSGHEDPTYEIAVLYDRGLRYTVTAEEGGDVRGYELAEIAQDPRVGATVDAAYVAAGQDLPRPRRG
jgi:hypothetical protein